jgi:hypothetical protein
MRNAGQKDPGEKAPPILHEADIGSGERSPGQHETDQMIKEIPPLQPGGGKQQDGGQSGNRQTGR